jgi:hypothetical protein
MEPDFGKTMQGAMMGTGFLCDFHRKGSVSAVCQHVVFVCARWHVRICPPKASTVLMPNAKSVDQALEDKKAKQKAGRKGKMGMTWDLEVKLIGGKNLMPKDTVGEGTYGTTFSHRCLTLPPPACRALFCAGFCMRVRALLPHECTCFLP